MDVRYPPSLRNVEDLLFERGIDLCQETVRVWWNRFGPTFGSEIRKKRGMAHNHFNQERHLTGRDLYRERPSPHFP
jgi:putative transposase